MLLDRGGNIAKKLFTHGKRNKGVTPMAEPSKNKFALPHDGLLPIDWDALIANRELTRREVYPLFYRAVMEIYTPPIDKSVVLDGAPDRPLDKFDFDTNKDHVFSNIYVTRSMRTDPNQMAPTPSRDLLATPSAPPPTVFRSKYDDAFKHSIQEADLSAFYHVNQHIRFPGCAANVQPHQSILIDSNDGDTLWIALLHARDRIDPQTFQFSSRLWVKLQGQERTRESYQEKVVAAAAKGEVHFDVIDGRDVYINVNKLYIDIDRDPDFSQAQYPQGTVVLLNILAGTDFFGDFSGDEYSLFHGIGWKPFVWDTWKKHAARFPNMVMLFYSGTAISNQPNLLRRPFIDEDALLVFIYQCYAAKYGKKVKEINQVKKVTHDMLADYTATFALNTHRKANETDEKFAARYRGALKKRIPPDAVLIRYARLALLNMTYWINDYRPNGSSLCDPLEEYEGLPYYGFVKDPITEHITLSPVCSPAKPIKGYYAQHTGAHLRQDREELRMAADKAATEEEASRADKARDAERMERQKAMLQREKVKREREEAAEARNNIVLPERFKKPTPAKPPRGTGLPTIGTLQTPPVVKKESSLKK